MEGRERISTKLFIGQLITSAMKMHLQSSSHWKNAKAMPSEEGLIEVRRQGKSYIGYYLKAAGWQLKDLRSQELAVARAIQSYLPELAILEQECVIFPQLFLQ